MKVTIQTKDSKKKPFEIIISTDGCGEHSYFSITGMGYPRKGAKANRCGCLHDEILEYRPDLKPLVDIHLRDLEGAPFWSAEGGIYWAGKLIGMKQLCGPSVSHEECLERFKRICWVDDNHVNLILEKLELVHNPSDPNSEKEVCYKWTEIIDNELRPIWKRKAENALEMIEKLVKESEKTKL